jgi:hypothetical protein
MKIESASILRGPLDAIDPASLDTVFGNSSLSPRRSEIGIDPLGLEYHIFLDK